MTDDNLIEMPDNEIEDVKYLSIFENNYHDFDEQIMGLEAVVALKMEAAMIDRTNNRYYRCKIKDEGYIIIARKLMLDIAPQIC